MPKREFENPLLSTRYAAIHAEFKPDGNVRHDINGLRDLWIEVQNHVHRLKDKQLRKEAREQRELGDAIDKLMPLVKSVLKGEQDVDAIADEVVQVVPDEELRAKTFEWFTDVIKRKPEKRTQEEIDATNKELAPRDKAIKCSGSIVNALTYLSEATEAGDDAAAEALLEAATAAAGFLTIAAGRNPERFRKLAAMTTMWPVIASDESGWEKSAVEEIKRLGLGERLAFLKTRLRPLRGSDVALPARRWAKAAIQTIDETRWRFPFFVNMAEQLGGSGAWADFAVSHNWDIKKYPDWVKDALALKTFSVATFDDWKAVVRDIIREQVPDFHLLPEWATQRATAEANGRNTPGEIQNAILDDIVSALKRLAPEAPC